MAAPAPGSASPARAPASASAATPTRKAAAARSKGYHLQSTWENLAALSDDQLRAVSALGASVSASATATRTMASDQGAEAEEDAVSSGAATAEEAQPLTSSHEFYKAHAELEAEVTAQAEEKYRSYARDLDSYAATVDELREQTTALLGAFAALQEAHAAAASHTESLSGQCEQLAAEKERLEGFADAVHAKLHMFDSLDEVSAAFAKASATANASGSPDAFLPILKSLDDAMEYVRTHAHYKDAGVYTIKFRQLQSRALGLVRSYVTASLRRAASAAQQQQRQQASEGEPTEEAGKDEMAGLYVRFRAAAPSLAPLTSELARRAVAAPPPAEPGSTPGGEYGQLLADCHAAYCDHRLQLVADTVHRRVRALAAEGGPAHLARAGCAYLAQVCQLERALFEHFFPTADAKAPAAAAAEAQLPGAGIASLLDPLCGVLYDLLRPMLVHTTDVDALCELVDALRGAAATGNAAPVKSGAAVAPMQLAGVQRVAAGAAQDAQERLAFRTSAFVRDDLDGHQYTAAQLDFPKVVQDGKGVPLLPLERAARLLGALYGALETHVFQQLAQEVVAAAVRSAQVASAGVARTAGASHGRLLLIRSLLYLRERIAPFDVDFTSHDAELDFSSVQAELRRMLSGQASLAAFTSANALGALLTRSTPKVRDVVVDAKADVEARLKAACEQFIMAATKAAVESVLSFITKVTAVRVSTQPRKPLAEQAFAAPDKAKAVVERATQALLGELKPMVAAMRLYVNDETTRAALLSPVRSNVLEAHAQFEALVRDEYSAEDAASIGALDTSRAESAVEAALRA